jgi:hypothetical protein
LIEVTDSSCGVWLDGNLSSPVEFDISIVELAIKHGYDILIDVWNADKPKFLNGASQELLDDLYVLADFSIQYLNEELPKNYFLDLVNNQLVLSISTDISDL